MQQRVIGGIDQVEESRYKILRRAAFRPLRGFGGTSGTVVYTVFVAAASYFGGIVIALIKETKETGTPYLLLILGGFVLVGLMSIIAALIGLVVQNQQKRDRRTINVVRYAYKTINLSLTKFIYFARHVRKRSANQNLDSVLEFQTEVIEEIYSLLEHEYGEGDVLEDRIDFEVTFMTKSYRDEELTIASWASRDGRAPKSLVARSQDSTIYHDTEADKLYNDPNHSVRIISRTSTDQYKELYPGQKARIKSSIIYPVFCDNSRIEGVVVVHCDKEEFFRQRDRKFWSELLDIYAKRLALCRVVTSELVTAEKISEPPY